MAALVEPQRARIVPLREITGADLTSVLDQEAVVWQERLGWDFSPSAALARRYVDSRSLDGFALWTGERIGGYCYYVREDHKALIGDLFLLDEIWSADAERLLLAAVLAEVRTNPGIRRAEAQLLMMRGGPLRSPGLKSYQRHYMMVDLAHVEALSSGRAAPRLNLKPWTTDREDDTARLIASCYEKHPDSLINDQYHSISGARRFLTNIVHYPGCGLYFAPGSFAAYDRETGALAGISLASLISSATGHITQICVAPWARGEGVGYELLRRSLVEMSFGGCTAATLTVTASNPAVRLYESVGFRAVRDFAAYVWEW